MRRYGCRQGNSLHEGGMTNAKGAPHQNKGTARGEENDMPIDRHSLESLLHMPEGPTLDFKREQYRFAKAPREDKAELLKDIMAFANTQRNRTAYILIGVDEVAGGHNEVIGVDDHPDDASFHQFVNGRTNRPVVFDYSKHDVNGKSVGVISIPVQQRPVYAEKRVGRVKINEVYIRDGSSTRPASPDEIAAMGRGNPPKLQADWGDATRRTDYPPGYVLRNTGLKLPDEFQTWDGTSGHYDFESLARKLGVDPAMYEGHKFTTIREMAMYRPLGLRLYNNSGSVGENVRFTATLEDKKHVRLKQPGNAASLRRHRERSERIEQNHRRLQSVRSGRGIEISVEVGDIRPGEYVWAGHGTQFSTKISGTLIWKVCFVADNLPEPIECLLPLQVEYEERYIQPQDLKSILMPRSQEWLP